MALFRMAAVTDSGTEFHCYFLLSIHFPDDRHSQKSSCKKIPTRQARESQFSYTAVSLFRQKSLHSRAYTALTNNVSSAFHLRWLQRNGLSSKGPVVT